ALAGYVVGARRAAAPALPAATPARHEAGPASLDDGATDDGFGAEKFRIIRSLESEAARLRDEITAHDARHAHADPFARDRERMFRELADARSETARYRQIV